MTTLTIVHTPYGVDSPYLPEWDERRPRDPVGGDMVSIGFRTTPGTMAETVEVHWSRNGRPQTPIGARPVARGVDSDRWLVELGVVEGGDAVDYWITATSGEETVTSPREHFTTHRWRRCAQIVGADVAEDGLRCGTIGDDGAAGPTLSITRESVTDAVRLSVSERSSALPAAEAAPADPESPTVEVQHGHVLVEVDGVHGQLRLANMTSVEEQPLIDALTLRWLEAADGRIVAVELTAPLEPDEAIVGFGERFDALDQHGRAPDVTVYEQYKNQGNRTYLPMPFFLSSAGYGCLVSGTTPVTYDFGRTVPDRWRCLAYAPVRGGDLDITFFAGSPATILGAFTGMTGRPDTLPAWAFGPWMSSNEWNTQARVLAELERTQQYDIPATVLVIEAWSDETTFYIWNGAQYTPSDGADALRLQDFTFPADGPWPNPEAMIDTLHAAGLRIVLWQIPALKHIDTPHPQHDTDVAHACEQGYVLQTTTGDVYRNGAFWFHKALIPDFTHPEATAWWLGKRAYLLDDLRVDGFKTDGGEHLQGRSVVAHDGRQGDELVNAFPNLYIGAYHRFARGHRGGDGLTFSRAGHTGVGAFPAHWAGDENSTWEAYRRSLVAGLTAAMSGVVFWGWDIAGFSEALPTAELYLRATAMAAFCPIMQYHSEYTPPGAPSKDRTPWNMEAHTGDDCVIPLSRFWANVRMNLLPYIVSEAAHAAASGEPLLRPLLLDYPHDPRCWRIDDQFGFGRDLLVAPVVEEGATGRRVYLPAGTWYDLWSGTATGGGTWIDVEVPWDRIPVFVRGGSILPLNLGSAGRLGDAVGNAVDRYTTLSLWLYPDGESTRTWVDVEGTQRPLAMARGADGRIGVTLPPLPVDCTVRLPDGTTRHVRASTEPQNLQLP